MTTETVCRWCEKAAPSANSLFCAKCGELWAYKAGMEAMMSCPPRRLDGVSLRPSVEIAIGNVWQRVREIVPLLGRVGIVLMADDRIAISPDTMVLWRVVWVPTPAAPVDDPR